MHEMPFTQAILEMAVKEAGGRPIRAIHLRVGALSAIVSGSVEVFFAFLSKSTLAEGARLVFVAEPISLTCRNCGRCTELPDHPDTNPRQILAAAFRSGCSCGQADLKITGGLGFEMTGIEIEV